MKLQEVFNRALAWEKNQHSSSTLVQYDFQSDGLPYEVLFERQSPARGQMLMNSPQPVPNVWLVEFSAVKRGVDGYGLTSTGNSIAVFATVVEIMEQFKQEYAPQFFTFLAKEPSRQALYARMSKRIGASVQTSETPNGEMRFVVQVR